MSNYADRNTKGHHQIRKADPEPIAHLKREHHKFRKLVDQINKVEAPARKKALLMHFGTAKAVRSASLDDLKRAPGVSAAVAQTVYDFYHQ